jgi:hypothetical protein
MVEPSSKPGITDQAGGWTLQATNRSKRRWLIFVVEAAYLTWRRTSALRLVWRR